MQLRQLGRTKLHTTRLGLGLAALGRPGYINLGHAADLGADYDRRGMAERAATVLDAAFAAGVRYFDAARSYGEGEAFLAEWLRSRRIEPSEVVIGSKWGYTYTAGWSVQATRHEVKEHTLPVLQRQANESQALLGEYLRLYQIHSATLESGVLDNSEVLRELARLRKMGWAIGFSVSGPKQADTIRKAMTLTTEGERLFAVVQATWNLLEPTAGPVLAEAHGAGMGVIIKEALANGRLTERNREPEFDDRRHLLEGEAKRLGCGLDALALAAVLAQPWVDVVLSGAATVEQLNTNVKALQVPWDSGAEAALAQIAERGEEYWRRRGEMEWN